MPSRGDRRCSRGAIVDAVEVYGCERRRVELRRGDVVVLPTGLGRCRLAGEGLLLVAIRATPACGASFCS